ncbi:hypothetical protein [Halorientalis regularis]|uniref:Uncharacterized protein n=1 Tax=Halorientalis regularis TaxID=660518 RepID=A0A1G7QVQ2_9EURY|nr:hypothetical protein [Halorientalis regularis]SDG02606.1 hypothetical protein SAMN05216218_113117 [Halorientalis regularis]
MQRRKYLATISATVSGLALAGCSSDSDDGGSGSDGGNGGGDSTPTPTPTSTPDPVSQLDVSGFATGNESTEDLVSQVEVTNPTAQSVTADFSARWGLEENKGEISSDSEEKTIEADSSQEFQLTMINADDFSPGEFIGLYYLGFQMEILVNGESRSNTCPDTEFSNPNEQGCEYPFGIYQTHVEVEYSGDWSGAAGGGGNTRTVSRQSSVVSETTDVSYVNVSDDASIISANAQKQDDSSEELTIRIVHRDEVVAEQSTSSAYGVAQVSENL